MREFASLELRRCWCERDREALIKNFYYNKMSETNTQMYVCGLVFRVKCA